MSAIRNDFYVYGYKRKRNDTLYYVGKGCGRRVFICHGRIKVPRDKSRIVFLFEGLTEEEAFLKEREIIAELGRVDKGTGILLNITDGGEGVSGRDPWNKGKRGLYSSDPRGVLKGTTMFKNLCTGEVFRAHSSEVDTSDGHIVGVRKDLPASDFQRLAASKRHKGVKKSKEHNLKNSMAIKGRIWVHNFETGQTRRVKKVSELPEGFVVVVGPHKLLTPDQHKREIEDRKKERQRKKDSEKEKRSESNRKAQLKLREERPLFGVACSETLLWLRILLDFSLFSFSTIKNSAGKELSVQRSFARLNCETYGVSLYRVLCVLDGRKSRPLSYMYNHDSNFKTVIDSIPLYRSKRSLRIRTNFRDFPDGGKFALNISHFA